MNEIRRETATRTASSESFQRLHGDKRFRDGGRVNSMCPTYVSDVPFKGRRGHSYDIIKLLRNFLPNFDFANDRFPFYLAPEHRFIGLVMYCIGDVPGTDCRLRLT